MNENHTPKLIKAFDAFAVWASLPLLCVLVGIYFLADRWDLDPKISPGLASMKTFTTSVVANIIPVFLLFMGSYFVLRRIQEIKAEERRERFAREVAAAVSRDISPLIAELSRPIVIERFNSAPWDEIIRKAGCIDITVHYLDTWINQHADAIKDFFRRKDARIRVVLPNPECELLVEGLLPRFPEMDSNALKHKIKNVSGKLRALREEAGANKVAVKIYRINKIQWYCAVRVDDSIAVLSVYENARKGGTQSPAFSVDLAKFPKVAEWLDREFDALVAESKLESESNL